MSEMFTVERDRNWDKLRVALTKSFSKNVRREVGIELIDGANRIRNRIQLSMQKTPRTGRTYKRKSVIHVASVAGNPPAPWDNDLRDNILMDDRLAQGEIEVGVLARSKKGKNAGKVLIYGKMLEKGTPNMEARPFMEPALNEEIGGIQANISRAVFFKGIQDTLR